MLPGYFQLRSEHFWVSSVLIALVDAALVLLLVWRIKPAHFRELKWPLAGIAAILWSIFGVVLGFTFWDSYYQYFFPAWFRYGGFLLLVPVSFALFALVFHWLALRLPGIPVVTFCLLAGLESVLEHLWGIYGLRILEVPMLENASPISVLVFSFPEYIFYWCVILGAAALFQKGWQWFREGRRITTRNSYPH